MGGQWPIGDQVYRINYNNLVITMTSSNDYHDSECLSGQIKNFSMPIVDSNN